MNRNHHERWDGRGYPDGLADEAIPIGAQLLAVADSFDAMVSDRPYRSGMAAGVARERLLAGVGSQFRPRAVTAFAALLDAGMAPGAPRRECPLSWPSPLWVLSSPGSMTRPQQALWQAY